MVTYAKCARVLNAEHHFRFTQVRANEGNGGREWRGNKREEQGGRGVKRGKGKKRCNHTDTTRSHVGGNHDGALAHFEFVENPITLVLLLVSVDG